MLESDKLSAITNIKHGFFTRKGGVSDGIYDSLNLGSGSNDKPENIVQNKQIIINEMAAQKLITLHQIHSNKVVIAAAADDNKQEADAIVTNKPNIAISILTADCVPVLFCDSENKIIAAAHAGWKGAISGILQNTISKMIDIGAKRQNIIAAIGPCISQNSYEVDLIFCNNFITQDTNNTAFFTNSTNENHYMFDIGGYVKNILEQQNISQIDYLEYDTYKNEDLFYSYRRSCHKNEPDYGRQISVISNAI